MQAYRFDKDGYFQETVNCQLDPLASQAEGREIYLLPGNSTYSEPLPAKEGFRVKWNGSKWFWEAIPEPTPYEPTPEELKQRRINELKGNLYASDYAIIKIAEGAAEREEYADLIVQREAWRKEINQLEGE